MIRLGQYVVIVLVLATFACTLLLLGYLAVLIVEAIVHAAA